MTLISFPLQVRLHAVEKRIQDAEQRFSRAPGSVKLLAVSKTWPAKDIAILLQTGHSAFGENYVQEALVKIKEFEITNQLSLDWHFIGSVQSNKTKLIAANFSWVHSIDKAKTAQQLSLHRPEHLMPLKVLVQVNISNEKNKGGCSVEAAEELCRIVATLPRLQLKGLMTIAEETHDFSTQRANFARLRQLAEHLKAKGLPMDELSMGMSHDLEAAIAEGATWVRVGSAIFGPRDYSK